VGLGLSLGLSLGLETKCLGLEAQGLIYIPDISIININIKNFSLNLR